MIIILQKTFSNLVFGTQTTNLMRIFLQSLPNGQIDDKSAIAKINACYPTSVTSLFKPMPAKK